MHTATGINEARARRRTALEDAIAERERRLGNVEQYLAWTAPGGRAESASAYRAWAVLQADLRAEIEQLQQELGNT